MISRMWLTLPAEYCTAQRPIAKPRLTAMLRPPSQELQAECLCLEAGPSTTGPLYEQSLHRPPVDWLIVSLCNSPAALPPDAIMPPSPHHKPLSARHRTATRPAAAAPPRCTTDTLVLVTHAPQQQQTQGSRLQTVLGASVQGDTSRSGTSSNLVCSSLEIYEIIEMSVWSPQ